jgi:hypothetical protein
VSKAILINGESRTVFLQRLVHGKASLYYYSSTDYSVFYLQEQDFGLVELPNKAGFRNILRDFMVDCEDIEHKIDLVDYKKKQLTSLVSMYNSCSSKPFPYAEFGIMAGYSINKLGLPSNYSGGIGQLGWSASSNTFVVGVSYNQPFFRQYYSIYTNILFTKTSYATTEANQDSETDILINLVTLEVPVTFRYTVPSLTYKPYFLAGGLFCYNLTNSSRIYETTIDIGEIMINKLKADPLMSDVSIGYVMGAGLRRSIAFNRTISLEARYSTTGFTAEYLNTNQIMILAGFTF